MLEKNEVLGVSLFFQHDNNYKGDGREYVSRGTFRHTQTSI